MNNIEFANSTEEYRKLVEQRGNPLEKIRVRQLEELDALCNKCVNFDEMLCEGSRLCAVGNYIQLVQCNKLADGRERKDWLNRATYANLGKKKINFLVDNPTFRTDANIFVNAGKFYVNDKELPEMCQLQYCIETTNKVKEYMLAFVHEGYKPKYLFTIQLYAMPELNDPDIIFSDYKLLNAMSEMICQPDWLHIDAIDYIGNARIRQTMLKCLRLRLDENKYTSVSYTTLEPKSDLEADIYEEITTWKQTLLP